MPDLTKKQLKPIQSRIETAIKAKTHDDWYRNAVKMRDIYKGKLWPGTETYSNAYGDSSEHQVTVNLAQVNTDIIVSSIAYAEPEYMLTPMEPSAVASIPYQKAALVKTMHEINAIRAQRRRLKDAVVYGRGVTYDGWRFEEEDSAAQEGNRPDYLPQEGPLPTIVMRDGGMMAPPEEPQADIDPEVVYDNPIIRRVCPYKFFVDPDHDDLSDLTDAQYVIEEKVVPISAVKGNKRYKNTSELSGENRVGGDEEDKERDNKRDSDEKLLKIYCYWQKEGRKYIEFANGRWDKPIYEGTWPYKKRRYPFVTLVYRDIPDEQTTQGAIEPAKSSVQLYNLYRTDQINHDSQMAKCPIVFDGSKLTEDGKKAMQSGKVGAMVESAQGLDVVAPIQMPALPQDFYATQAGIKDDVDITMAVNGYRQGLQDNTRRTLGEVNMTVSLSESRAQCLQRDHERACEQDAEIVLSLLQDPSFCDTRRWMVMTGADGQDAGVDWNAETLAGRSQVKIVCNSTRVQTPEALQQTMAFAMQSLAPYVQGGVINIMPFIRKFGQSINMTPQELEEVMRPQNGGGGAEMQQGMEMLQQLGQAVQQLMQQTQQMQAQLTGNGVDAKTQADLAAKQQQMQQSQAKFEAEMQMMLEKHRQEMEQAETELALTVEQAQQRAAIEEQNAETNRRIRATQAAQKAQANGSPKASAAGGGD